MIDPIDRYMDIADRGNHVLKHIPGYQPVVACLAFAIAAIVLIPLMFPLFIVGFIVGGLSPRSKV